MVELPAKTDQEVVKETKEQRNNLKQNAEKRVKNNVVDNNACYLPILF